MLDNVVEKFPAADVLHDHEDVRRGGDDLESKRFFYFKKLTENAETVLDSSCPGNVHFTDLLLLQYLE